MSQQVYVCIGLFAIAFFLNVLVSSPLVFTFVILSTIYLEFKVPKYFFCCFLEVGSLSLALAVAKLSKLAKHK